MKILSAHVVNDANVVWENIPEEVRGLLEEEKYFNDTFYNALFNKDQYNVNKTFGSFPKGYFLWDKNLFVYRVTESYITVLSKLGRKIYERSLHFGWENSIEQSYHGDGYWGTYKGIIISLSFKHLNRSAIRLEKKFLEDMKPLWERW